MPNGKRKAGGRRNKNAPGKNKQSLIAYNGPIKLPNTVSGNRVYPLNLRYDVASSTTSGGIANVQFGSDCSSSSTLNPAIQWAQQSDVFREFRVLGFTVHWTPGLEGGTLLDNPSAWYVVEDRSSNSSLSTYAAAAQYASVTMHPVNKRFSRTIKMAQTGESVFYPVAGPIPAADQYYIKAFMTNVGVSNPSGSAQTYGRWLVEFLVEFVGHI